MRSPTVSIVVPLYNKEEFITRALTSVLAQTFLPLEIIVVDDGSTDGGPERVLRFNDPRISLSRQENRGPGAARNTGLAVAKGKYVAFLDADDEYLPSFLEAGISFLEENDPEMSMVYTGFYSCPGMRPTRIGMHGPISGALTITPETDLRLVHQLCHHWVCATIMRTDVVRKWGGFFSKYKCLFHEDVFLSIKLAFNETIGVIPEPHVIYHTDASSLYAGGSIVNIQPSPVFEDVEDLLDACPPSTLPLLKRFLAQKVIGMGLRLAKLGYGKDAKRLIRRFHREGFLSAQEARKGRAIATLAPVLPSLRWIWRKMKPKAGLPTYHHQPR